MKAHDGEMHGRQKHPSEADTLMKNFPVVCVGGSAGALDAYIRLLTHLPADMGVAIVIVNHITSMPTQLHEVLPRFSRMPVELITEDLLIEPHHVYIDFVLSPEDIATELERIAREEGSTTATASAAVASA